METGGVHAPEMATPPKRMSDGVSENLLLLEKTEPSCFPKRYNMMMLGFFAYLVTFLLKTMMGVVIVAMRLGTNYTDYNGTIVYKPPQFNITGTEEGVLLSVFYGGYVIPHFVSGWLSNMFGGKPVIGISLGVASVLTALTPAIAKLGLGFLILMRILVGACCGPAYPALHTIWGQWTPRNEVTSTISMTVVGIPCGILISMFLGGVLAEQFGWESVFYAFGVATFLWCCAWWIFGYSTPHEHPSITQDELSVIDEGKGYEGDLLVHGHVPWKQILTSVEVWGIIVAFTCNNAAEMFIAFYIPMYFHSVYGMGVEKSGMLGAIPIAALVIGFIPAGHFADVIINRGFLSKTNVRKVYAAVSMLGQAITLSVLAFTQNIGVAIAMLAIYGFLQSLAETSVNFVNQIDISPRFAGIIMSLSNTVAVLAIIIGLFLGGFIVKDYSMSEWRICFLLGAAADIIGSVVYTIIGTGEMQKWG